ncbi:TIGR00730 family Rossman fold protein [Bacillus sp. Marseille-P3661]|uniref:LOG family protein n=1 Tax=Bacillus sp. Marseille-P3661 TaxID=1936234 RepID=UPI000C847347|nr:TIGR00730 family Rossman fold protein [Bacillus sp. Marseille-P3661]
MKRVGVFCGSRDGLNPLYKEMAVQLGQKLVENKLSLVYGGSSTGLMGAVADKVVEMNGEAIGVLPTILSKREIAHSKLTDLRIVNSMPERKAQMYDLSDAFIVMPGGIGTMEEFFEIFTLHSIGEHSKPVGILNVGQYFDPLIDLLDHMVEQEFLLKKTRDVIFSEEDPEQLINVLLSKSV